MPLVSRTRAILRMAGALTLEILRFRPWRTSWLMVGTETLFPFDCRYGGGRLAARSHLLPGTERLGRETVLVCCPGDVPGVSARGCPLRNAPWRMSRWGDSGGRRRARRSQARSRPRARSVAAGPNECQTYGPAPEQASEGLVRGRMEVTGDRPRSRARGSFAGRIERPYDPSQERALGIRKSSVGVAHQ